MPQYHNKNETRLEVFFYKPVVYYEFVTAVLVLYLVKGTVSSRSMAFLES